MRSREAVSRLAGDSDDRESDRSLSRLDADLVWRNSIRAG
jgi:hypothetical protein